MTARVSVRDRVDLPEPLGVVPHETPLVRLPASTLDETFIGTQVMLVCPDQRAGGRVVALAGGISDVLQIRTGDALAAPCGLVTIAAHPLTVLWVRGRMALLTADDHVLAAPPPAAYAAP